ncbi:hypothetical protein RZS08_32345 [Arthrospira platensis SPKY1]|nr:hypothetical protein [Arthrospira platensis SPKY1]
MSKETGNGLLTLTLGICIGAAAMYWLRSEQGEAFKDSLEKKIDDLSDEVKSVVEGGLSSAKKSVKETASGVEASLDQLMQLGSKEAEDQILKLEKKLAEVKAALQKYQNS